MKILLLSDLNSIHTKKWIKALSEKGIEIQAFGLGRPQDDFFDQFENVTVHHAEFTNQYGKSGLNKLKYLKVVKRLKQIEAAFSPDIVHAHYATSYGLIGTFLKHENFLISVWGEDVFSFPKESIFKKILFKRNLRKAKAIFSTSQVMAKEAEKYTEKKVNVVPFGVDVSVFRPDNQVIREEYLVIGIVKTLEDKYGIKFLIEAFSRVLKTNPSLSLKLLIVGKGRKEYELKSQVASLGIEKFVEFTGAVPHASVPSYFNQMDIVVVPSVLDGESFGVAAVEASACEKPVIVSNVGGLPEVVIEGITGLICEPRNATCLAEKMDLLIRDEHLRIQLGQNGRMHVLQNYDWNQNVALMVSYYNTIYNSIT